MKVRVDSAVIKSIHSLGVGVSKDDITPVIQHIALKREGDTLRAMTTDRYTVLSGVYEKAVFEDWDDEAEVLVDPKQLKLVVDYMRTNKLFVGVEIVRLEDGSAVAYAGSDNKWSVGSLNGAFPPVSRLFPTSEANGAGMLNIRPDFLAKLAKVLPPEVRPDRERVWSFEFRSIDNPHKPQPVYAKYQGEGYAMESLIQPALIKS